MIVAFIFDSGRMETYAYGEEVFKFILQGKELTKNPTKMIISYGDIIPKHARHIIDIEPYIIKDSLCTIDFDKTIQQQPIKDYPFCWVIEDIEETVAVDLDKRLKQTCIGYIGLSRIDINSDDEKKQFWKDLIRNFAMHKNIIIAFQDPDIEDVFCYEETAKKLGYFIEYNKENEFISIEESKDKKSTFVKSDDDLRIIRSSKQSIDRDLLLINFSLRKELQISGCLIWQSINDIDKIDFSLSGGQDYLIEYPFLTLYHASQGIERIQKAIIELICKKNHLVEEDKEKVMRLLYSHSHVELNAWIETQTNQKFDSSAKKMMNVLMKFYNDVRYSRYSDNVDSDNFPTEYKLLLELKNKTTCDIDKEIKRNFGQCLGRLSKKYFQIYDELCTSLHIFAYELDYYSSANIVFNHSSEENLYVTLKQMQQAKKELLYWTLKNANRYPKNEYINIQALNFDESIVESYIHELICDPENCQDLYSSVGEFYDELCAENKIEWKNRVQLIDYFISKKYK